MGDEWKDVVFDHEDHEIAKILGLKKEDLGAAAPWANNDVSWDSDEDDDSKESKRPIVRKKPRPRASDEMAQRIMDALCQNGQGDFLLLQDDEIREWWNGVTGERDRIARREAEKRRREELRERALNKLTAEERQALGIK